MTDQAGVAVAYGDDALAATPTYTRIDDPAGIHVVSGWRTNRGRQYQTDQMQAGSATVAFIDKAGTLDPTNTMGPFYPMNPNCPGQISLYNPVTASWHTVYRGLMQDCPQRIRYQGAAVSRGTLGMLDLFSLLAEKEVPPGLDFDNTGTGASTANVSGDTTYAQQNVDDRIKAILADAGIPAGLQTIFSGNVVCQFTVYSPGTAILTALQDAADAEFPGVANLYVDKTGIFTFHGRLARFNSGAGNPYGIQTWKVGDETAVESDTTLASIETLDIDRDVTKIVNNALFAPQNIAPADIAAQLSIDAGSITTYGPRGLSGLDLKTAGGTVANIGDPLTETKQFSDFYKDNLAAAQTRIGQATFRTRNPARANASAHWALLCNVELNDIIEVTTTHPGGGGFTMERFFVEGISYECELSGPTIPIVTMTLDLSNKGIFTTETWADPH